MPQHIVIAAGGTAGHVVPALAVADVLRDRGARVTFIGTADRAEAELVPRAGYPLHCLNVRGLDRRNPLKAAAAAGLAATAALRARRLLKRLRADVVMGAGGYVSGPVGLAAVTLRLPLLLSEADSCLGVANRLLAPFARRVCLAFAIQGREGEKFLVTGRPVPAQTGRISSDAARKQYGVRDSEWVVLVFGGSLGARTINEAACEAFAARPLVVERPVHILHVCGKRDHDAIEGRLQALGGDRYDLIDYVTPGFATLLAAADLVVARAGGSVFELAAAGKPALLIPYPYATGGHQERNASWMGDAGAAVVIGDADLTPVRLREEVERLLSDPTVLNGMATASKSLAMPEAAQRVADEVLSAT